MLKNIFIPASVEVIEDECCDFASELKTVTISPSNKNFKYLGSKGQILIWKSDKNKDISDTIIFANRDIEEATIPNTIEYINQNAFENCESLLKIEFTQNSKYADIDKNTLFNSSIESLFIPASVEDLHDNWCSHTKKLKTVTISPSNNNFKYFDSNGQIIVGKSDTNKEIFDTIIFSTRDIEEATIPSYIKYIKPNAFEYCKNLNTIAFSKDSELNSITIPKSVCIINSCAFFLSKKLKKVCFEEGSKLLAFNSLLFFSCENLETVEIPENSSLQYIYDSVFSFTSITNIFIPSNLKQMNSNWKPLQFHQKTKILNF